MHIIEETYRLTDMNDPSREIGLMEIVTTMTPGAPLYAHCMRIYALGDQCISSGDYRLDFVKKVHSPDMYRRVNRTFNQLARSNDRGQP